MWSKLLVFPDLTDYVSDRLKRMARFPQRIAHNYVILYCNHFSILSKVTNFEITIRDQCASRAVTSVVLPVKHPHHPLRLLVPDAIQNEILSKLDSEHPTFWNSSQSCRRAQFWNCRTWSKNVGLMSWGLRSLCRSKSKSQDFKVKLKYISLNITPYSKYQGWIAWQSQIQF